MDAGKLQHSNEAALGFAESMDTFAAVQEQPLFAKNSSEIDTPTTFGGSHDNVIVKMVSNLLQPASKLEHDLLDCSTSKL